jgi:tripartite ATP-independent transporter DctP family solute receptor
MFHRIKSFRPLAMAAIVAVSACLAAPTAALAKPVKMRLGHIFAIDSPIDQASKAFADRVRERTNGEIDIAVFPNSQIGGDEALARDISRGSVELAFLNPGSLSGLDPLLDFHYLPYIATTFEEVDKIFYNPEGVLQKTITETMLKQRIRPIGFFELEFRAVTNSKHAVSEPGDLRGLKIRVPGSAVIREFFIESGAQAVTMPFPELFTALQQGTIDGQDNGPSLTHNSRLFEAQKFMTNTNHVYAMGAITVSQRVWDRMSEENRQIFLDTAAEVAAEEIALNRKVSVEYLKNIENGGVKVQSLTPEALKNFQEVAERVWVKMEPVYGKERVDALREEVNSIRN